MTSSPPRNEVLKCQSHSIPGQASSAFALLIFEFLQQLLRCELSAVALYRLE